MGSFLGQTLVCWPRSPKGKDKETPNSPLGHFTGISFTIFPKATLPASLGFPGEERREGPERD
jgi:hypothetical protein